MRKFISTVEEIFTQTKREVQSNVFRALDFKDEMMNVWKYGEEEGEPIGFDSLHPHLRWRKGYIYCFTGYPQSGKSEFLNHLAVIRATQGHKIALYSPESYPLRLSFSSLVRCYLGKNIDKNYANCATEEEYEEALQWVHDHFFFLKYSDIPRLDQLLADLKMLIKTDGIGMTIVDPFNAVAEGAHMGDSNVSKYLKVALTQMKMFAEDEDIVSVIVEHPRSPKLDPKGNLPLASPWMLYGGSMWWNKMDCIVSTDRPQDSSIVKIRVWKMKQQRLNGKPNLNDPVELNFNVATNRYSEDFEAELLYRKPMTFPKTKSPTDAPF